MIIDRRYLRHCSKELLANLKEANNIEDLLKAFDKRQQMGVKYHPIKPKFEPILYQKMMREL